MSKKLRSLLILLLGIGLAYWFISSLDWQAVGANLRNARIELLVVSVLLMFVVLLVRALRWQVLLAPLARVQLGNSFAATSIGFGSIFIFGRAGEIVRPVILSLRERLRPTATIATILIERLFDTTTVVGMFAVNLLFFQPPANSNADVHTLSAIKSVGGLMALGIVVGITLLVLLRLKSEKLIGLLERMTKGLPKKLTQPLINLLRHLAEGLSVLVNLRELALVSFLSLLVWGLVTASTWLIVKAFGVDYSVSYIIFVLGFGLVGSTVPTPGGSAGAFHTAAAFGLMFLGMERNLAGAIAILYHLVAFGSPFIIGLFYLVRDGISLSQLREMMTQDDSTAAAPASQ